MAEIVGLGGVVGAWLLLKVVRRKKNEDVRDCNGRRRVQRHLGCHADAALRVGPLPTSRCPSGWGGRLGRALRESAGRDRGVIQPWEEHRQWWAPAIALKHRGCRAASKARRDCERAPRSRAGARHDACEREGESLASHPDEFLLPRSN